MKVKSKFDVGDVVWFMYCNKPTSQKITGVRINVSGETVCVDYVLNYEDIKMDEDCFYATKEELLKSL